MPYNAALKSAFQSAHIVFQNIIGETFTIAGDATEYDGVFDEDNTRKPFRDDGMGIMEEEQPLSCYAVISQFADGYDAKAQVGKILTRAGSTTYRITAVREDRIGYQFDLEEPDK